MHLTTRKYDNIGLLHCIYDSRLTSSILHVGFHEEFYLTLGGKLANFHKTYLTAVTPLVVLYTIREYSKIHNVADTARYRAKLQLFILTKEPPCPKICSSQKHRIPYGRKFSRA